MAPEGSVLALFSDHPSGLKLQFQCPGCGCPHYVQVQAPEGPVWGFNQDWVRPTFTPSILTSHGQGTRCHSFVQDGQINGVIRILQRHPNIL